MTQRNDETRGEYLERIRREYHRPELTIGELEQRKENERKRNRLYYHNNRGRIRAAARSPAGRKKNRQHQHAWRAKNPERERAINRKSAAVYRLRHPQKVRESKRRASRLRYQRKRFDQLELELTIAEAQLAGRAAAGVLKTPARDKRSDP
jgi:hypothetical protein